MSGPAIIVAHRERLAAEGIAAALVHLACFGRIDFTTSVFDLEVRAQGADGVAVDTKLVGADEATTRLRERGVRVVFMGDAHPNKDESVWVSTEGSIASLASALAPEIPLRGAAALLLTQREREVLELVSRGLAGKQVARRLGVSPKTVELYKTRIFSKLGVPNQTAAVRAGLTYPWERLLA